MIHEEGICGLFVERVWYFKGKGWGEWGFYPY